MTTFYTNKHPIQGCIQHESGQWEDLPEGNIFTIEAIQAGGGYFLLKPISEIKGLSCLSFSPEMLNIGFTKSDSVK